MKKKQKTQLMWAGIVVAIIAIVSFLSIKDNAPGELDDFAQCIDQSGATFYGAFWCPHCKDQKEAFGNSERLLPYVECSTPDGNGVTIACQQAGITGYPTWEFADGSRESGNLSLQFLAEKTGCQLPS